MATTLFYVFSFSALLSCVICIFAVRKTVCDFFILVFLLSLSGIFTLINSGYIAFIILISCAVYFSFATLKRISFNTDDTTIEDQKQISTFPLVIIALTGALIASQLSSNMWQGEVYMHKEVSLANLGELMAGEYFIYFLAIFTSFFLIFSDSNSRETVRT